MASQNQALCTRRDLLLATLGTAAAGVFCDADPAVAEIASPASAAVWARAQFPLGIAPGRRYLQDAAGKPFLIHGDTAWSLIAQLTLEDAEHYLQDRSARGFNTILVNLLEHKFSTKAPANIYAQPPFLRAGDFRTPNEAYFAHADRVLRLAAEYSILVLLAPAYVGAGGGNEGWYQTLLANETSALREYGRYLGGRYAGHSNIVWVNGGDFNPPDKDRVRAIADGIRELDARALHTAHCAPGTAAIEYWKGEPWLRINNVYTYEPVHVSALTQHARREKMPFFLIESAYENEHRAGELRIRSQAYHSLLSGAAGQVYGNNPIWHFDGPGLYSAPVSWRHALDSRGARSMAHVRRLLETLPWWSLEPDIAGVLVIEGHGSGQEKAVAAYAPDKSVAIAYLPSIRHVRIDLQQLAGPEVKARWYDPAGGRFVEIAGSPFAAEGSRLFRPEALNSAGHGDWLLLLENKPQ